MGDAHYECGQPYRLVRETPTRKVYTCGCEGMRHETLLRDGEEYVLGSSGSLVLGCRRCGEEHLGLPDLCVWLSYYFCFLRC